MAERYWQALPRDWGFGSHASGYMEETAHYPKTLAVVDSRNEEDVTVQIPNNGNPSAVGMVNHFPNAQSAKDAVERFFSTPEKPLEAISDPLRFRDIYLPDNHPQSVCVSCGGLVWDKTQHTAWHESTQWEIDRLTGRVR